MENSHICLVHVLVNANGKNASSTFLPCSADSVTSVPEVDERVKSGAGAPTRGSSAMRLLTLKGLSLLGVVEPLTPLGPIHHVPPRRHVVGPAVLVLQVVRVLPHVDA